MSRNYPDNVHDNDPAAPWNQTEPEECEACAGSGRVTVKEKDPATGEEYDDEMNCEECDGSGEQPEPEDEEDYDDRGENE